MTKFTHPFMHLLVLAMLSLALFVLMVVLGVALGVTDGHDPGSANTFLIWNSFSQVAMFGLPPLVVATMYYRGRQREYLKIDISARQWLSALSGVVILLLLVPLTDWLTVWNDSWHWSGVWEAVERELRRVGEESQGLVESMLKESHPLLSLLCVALVPAICEELFFRAGIQNLLRRWFKNVHVAVWVTAAIFSLAHGEVFAFLPRFLLGALLGYLYEGSGSLVVNVLVHFFNNAIVVIFFWFATPDSGIDPTAPLGLGWAVTVACSAAAVLLLLIVTFGKRLKISK